MNIRSKQRAFAVAAALALTAAACASPEDKVEKYVKSGEEFLEKGDLGRANVQFQNALKINEENVPALMGVAEIAETKQDYGALFAILLTVVRLEPDNVEALAKLGALYSIKGETKNALEAADKALAVDPSFAGGHSLKAAIQLQLGDRAGAVEFANQALALDPASAEAYSVLAMERAAADDLQGALAKLEAGVKANAAEPTLQVLRIALLARLGRKDDVKAAFGELIAAHPKTVSYRQSFANFLIEEGELAPARAELEEVARLLPDSLDAKFDVVRIANRIGGAAAARKAFETYAAAEPGNADLTLAFADFLRQQQDFAGAETLLKTLDETARGKPDSRRARNALAAIQLLQGRKDEARALIESVLEEDAEDGDALMRLASLKIDEGRLDEAVADLRAVVAGKPDAHAAKMLLGTAFERKGDLDYAESQMALAVNDSSFDPRMSNVFAKFLIRRGDIPRAEKILSDSLARHKNVVDNLKLLAAVQLMQQNWRAAEETAKAIQKAAEGDSAADRILGAAYSGLKDYKSAIEVLSGADAKAPLSTRPLALLVAAYVKDGRAEAAETRLRDIIARDPKNYDARLLLVQTLGQMKRNADAEAELKAAIAADPARGEAVESLYRYYRGTRRDAEARALAEDAVRRAPDNDGFKLLLADWRLVEGRKDDALAIYADVLSRSPGNAVAANNYASLLLDSKSDADSLKKALAAAKGLEGQENPHFLDTLGWALYRTGSAVEAVPVLEKALAAAPNLAEARYHLGAALIAAGEKERGVEELNKAVEAAGEAAFAAQAAALLAENR
jgi:Tfp pilus assembly protein PilF